MRFFTALAVGATCLSACHALPSPISTKYVVHEKRDAEGWLGARSLVKRDRMDMTKSLPIRIGLAQNDLHRGHDWLMDVSHPASPNYGKHWTASEVNKAFAPTLETVQAVREWLVSSGIDAKRMSLSDNKGWIGFDATIEEAEQLFHAQYYEHEHRDESKYSVGCDEYVFDQALCRKKCLIDTTDIPCLNTSVPMSTTSLR